MRFVYKCLFAEPTREADSEKLHHRERDTVVQLVVTTMSVQSFVHDLLTTFNILFSIFQKITIFRNFKEYLICTVDIVIVKYLGI